MRRPSWRATAARPRSPSNMHLYITLLQGFRRRGGAPDAERCLKRVVEEDLVLMTSGGSDWLWPTGERGRGRRRLPRQRAQVVLQPGAGRERARRRARRCATPTAPIEVLMFGVPMNADGVEIVETWDTLGMRATASHDVSSPTCSSRRSGSPPVARWNTLDATVDRRRRAHRTDVRGGLLGRRVRGTRRSRARRRASASAATRRWPRSRRCSAWSG